MNLSWSEDQQLLIDSAQRFAARYYTADVRAASKASASRCSPQVWSDLAEQGWLGLATPETAGGFGGGALEIGILAEAAGRCLLVEPYLWTAVEAVRLIRESASGTTASELLSKVADGTLLLAVADREDAGYASEPSMRATAEPTATGWRLNGEKRFVMGAVESGALIVSAIDTHGGRPALFLVPTGSPGIQGQHFTTIDSRAASHMVLKDVHVGGESRIDQAGQTDVATSLRRARDAVRLALCSEAVGAMQFLLDETVAYSQTRQQFGRPLAANQVLRHRLVDMAVAIREAKALALRAAIFHDQPDASDAERHRALLGATAKATQASRLVAEEAIQMHGAMGVTEELTVGLYVKRLLFCQLIWGPLSLQHTARAELDRPAAERETAAAVQDRETV